MIRLASALASISLLLTACGAEDASSLTSPVVYDDDDRIEVYQETDATRRTTAERAIVALIPKAFLNKSGTTYSLSPSAGTLDDFVEGVYGAPLCADQRFITQPAAADCSGTLIDEDLVLTAGHCADSLSQCRGFHFVFDYYYTAAGTLAQIDEDDVYECESIVAQRYDMTSPYLDYAIIRLTRAVVGNRTPAELDPTDDALAIGTDITVMGFGSGLPLKIDTGGEVISSTSGRYSFDGTPDTFGGNSGSGVFDASGRVVGILVAGQEDYVARSGQSCSEVNVLDPDIDEPVGETITYVHRALEGMCEDHPEEALCASCGDDVCSEGETLESCPSDCSGEKKGRCAVSAPGSREGGDGFGLLLLSCIALTTLRRRRA